MSNNKQSSVDWLIDNYFGGIENCSPMFRSKIAEAKAIHKEEHSNTWDDSVDNYKKRGENDMRHWVDFDEYYNETFNK